MKKEKPGTPDSTTPESRRSTLKTLLSGAGVVAGSQALPEQWLKPVVSSIVMPAHAQTSPSAGPAFECNGIESQVTVTGNSEAELDAQVSTEADEGTEVLFILRDPGTGEFNSGSGDVILTSPVVEGVAAAEGSADGEWSSTVTETTLDIDIGNDGEIDCSTEANVFLPGGP